MSPDAPFPAETLWILRGDTCSHEPRHPVPCRGFVDPLASASPEVTPAAWDVAVACGLFPIRASRSLDCREGCCSQAPFSHVSAAM